MVLPAETLVNILLCFNTFSCTTRPIPRNTTLEPYSRYYMDLVPGTSNYVRKDCEDPNSVFYDMLCTCIDYRDVQLFDDAKERIKRKEFTKAPDCSKVKEKITSLTQETEQVMQEQEPFRTLPSGNQGAVRDIFIPTASNAMKNTGRFPGQSPMSNVANWRGATPRANVVNNNFDFPMESRVNVNLGRRLPFQGHSVPSSPARPFQPPLQFGQGNRNSFPRQEQQPVSSGVTKLQTFNILLRNLEPSQIVTLVRTLPLVDVMDLFMEMSVVQRSNLWTILSREQRAYITAFQNGRTNSK